MNRRAFLGAVALAPVVVPEPKPEDNRTLPQVPEGFKVVSEQWSMSNDGNRMDSSFTVERI